MEYGLGIDVGTTFTAAAVATSKGVEICTLGTRAAAIPTVVLARADGEMLVGEAAERRAVHEPDRAASAFKRRLGDPTPIVLGGAPYGAETLIAHVLKSVVGRVTEMNGAAPAHIVLTHPASYGAYKLDLLRQAARYAGIEDVGFVAEPQAAAVHYAESERLEIGSVAAVYDFGGGTFDAALLRRTATGFDVIGQPEGLERLGGIDLDHAVFQHVLRAIGHERLERSDDPGYPEALARLRAECRTAKEALSADADAAVSVAFADLVTQVRITRPEFEDMVRPRIADTIDALRRAARSAGLELDQVDRILLVGGTSRIPLVAEMVRSATGRPVAVDIHAKHSVAMGAAALTRTLLSLDADHSESSRSAPPASPTPTPDVPVATAATTEQRHSRTQDTAVMGPPAIATPTASASPPQPHPNKHGAGPTVPPTKNSPVAVSPGPASTTPARSARRRIALVGGLAALLVGTAAIVMTKRGDSEVGRATSTTVPVNLPSATDDGAPTATAGQDSSLIVTDVDSSGATDLEALVARLEEGAVEPLADLLPRNTRYGGVEASVERLILRRQDPGGLTGGIEVADDGPVWAYAVVALSNVLEQIPLVASGADLTLNLADGTSVIGLRVAEPPMIEPGQGVAALIAFELFDGADLAGATITVADAGDTPAVIGLGPEEVLLAEPVAIPLNIGVAVVGVDGFTSEWGMSEATSSFDADYDTPDLSGGQATVDRRASIGYRWINLPISINAAEGCACDGVAVDGSMVTLEFGGTPYQSTNTFAEVVPPGRYLEVLLSFEVPLGAGEATLRVGDQMINVALP